MKMLPRNIPFHEEPCRIGGFRWFLTFSHGFYLVLGFIALESHIVDTENLFFIVFVLELEFKVYFNKGSFTFVMKGWYIIKAIIFILRIRSAITNIDINGFGVGETKQFTLFQLFNFHCKMFMIKTAWIPCSRNPFYIES